MTRLQEQGRLQTAPLVRQLRLLQELFQRLHAERILYCHWKSNEHLGASMCGRTDLDLLVHRSAAVPLARLFAELGFKRFVVTPAAAHPGIEDYLGFDEDTGALAHLHIHYRLTLGAKFVKGHRLPWEEALLGARLWDSTHGIYTADPEHELVLLLVRAALKLRMRDVAVAATLRPMIRGDTLREMRWLSERIDPDKLRRDATPLIGEAAAAMSDEMRKTPASLRQLTAFRNAIVPALRTYRLYSPLRSQLRALAREVATVWTVLVRRYRASGIPVNWSTRTPPQGGIVVELIGIGGSGKTTATRLLADWLSREAAVFPVTAERATHGTRQAAQRARDRGMIVLSDGPLAAAEAGSPSAPQPASTPDLVLRLDLPPEVASGRTGADVDQLRKEQERLDDRTYAARTRLVTIDALQSPAEMLLQLKHAIWEEL